MQFQEPRLRVDKKNQDAVDRKLNGPGSEIHDGESIEYKNLRTNSKYRHKWAPTTIIIFMLLHVISVHALYKFFTLKIKVLTVVWAFSVAILGALGTTLAAHRGFSHNSFKLTTFGQVLAVICQTIAGQNHIYWWVRDHRLHHKFVDTDADPYNARRGFFFSHMGWLMMKKHPMVTEKGRTIDMSDLEANKLIMFQKKFYPHMFIIFNVLMPTIIPIYVWDESLWIAFSACFACRSVIVLHLTWTINSFGHKYGTKPFDARISANQSNICNFTTLGDGWHNYHHAFPMDHTISEYGYKGGFNTKVLYFLKRIGIAFDFKTVPKKVIYEHSKRHGDGSLMQAVGLDIETNS